MIMNKPKTIKKNILPGILMALSFSFSVCASTPAAYADEMPSLQPEAASVESGIVEEKPAAENSTTEKTTTLNGGVHKSDKSKLEAENQDQAAAATQPGADDLYRASVQKLSKGIKLSTDEYRNLGIGILGFDMDRTFYTKVSVITRVYPGTPAADAGMKVGDKVYQSPDKIDDSKVVDPTKPVWIFSCGKAGETADYMVKRHGKEVSFHLVRMNMEDVTDDQLRPYL